MSFLRRHLAAVLAVAISVVAVASLYMPVQGSGPFGRALVWFTSPVQQAVVALADGVSGVYHGYLDLFDARREADELEDINNYLQRRLADLKPLEDENARLRRLLDFKRRVPLRYLPGRVIATDILGEYNTITINIGQDDGVRKGYPVVNADGVIGRVIDVYPGLASVLLMIDPNSSIDGVVRRSGAQGIIQGTSQKHEMLCQFAFSLRTAELRIGDVVVTTGLDQQLPPGLVLGRVSDISREEFGIFQEATVVPAVDFRQLREVLVIEMGGDLP